MFKLLSVDGWILHVIFFLFFYLKLFSSPYVFYIPTYIPISYIIRFAYIGIHTYYFFTIKNAKSGETVLKATFICIYIQYINKTKPVVLNYPIRLLMNITTGFIDNFDLKQLYYIPITINLLDKYNNLHRNTNLISI